VRAVPRAAVAVTALAVLSLVASCGDAEQTRDPGGRLTATQVRSCLEQRPPDGPDLLVRTTAGATDHFVGVLMMDLSAAPSHTASIGIAIYDDADLLDAYEDRAREDPEDEVSRVQNAVVSSHGPFSGRLALGRRWVHGCLR
jgi:hypothetical protein